MENWKAVKMKKNWQWKVEEIGWSKTDKCGIIHFDKMENETKFIKRNEGENITVDNTWMESWTVYLVGKLFLATNKK